MKRILGLLSLAKKRGSFAVDDGSWGDYGAALAIATDNVTRGKNRSRSTRFADMPDIAEPHDRSSASGSCAEESVLD